VSWIARAWLVAKIDVRLLPERQTQASFSDLLRTIGFVDTGRRDSRSM